MESRSLEDFVDEVQGSTHLRVEYDFGDGYVRLRTSEAERRQALQDIGSSEDILIELLRNARDAHASHIFVATGRSEEKRSIVVIDDGEGIPESMHEHIFEPRVTSKLDTARNDKWGMHGRGMALFSISERALSAEVVSSIPSLGSSIAVLSNVSEVAEKADQSSFPSFSLDEQGTVNVRGPRNLLRTACEFAIEERATCEVYLGSATEIAAALYELGMSALAPVDRVFCRDVETLPLVKRLATAEDPDAFARMAAELGIEISQRSARRVMDGEIDAAPNMLERVVLDGQTMSGRMHRKRSLTGGRLRTRIEETDLRTIAESAEAAFREVAGKYYLEGSVSAEARIRNGKLNIAIPIIESS